MKNLLAARNSEQTLIRGIELFLELEDESIEHLLGKDPSVIPAKKPPTSMNDWRMRSWERSRRPALTSSSRRRNSSLSHHEARVCPTAGSWGNDPAVASIAFETDGTFRTAPRPSFAAWLKTDAAILKKRSSRIPPSMA